MEAEVDEIRRRVLEAPAASVIANHGYGLFELAAIHLSQQPPSLSEARLAIDALGAMVDALRGQLGPDEQSLVDGVAQLRLAWVQLDSLPSSPAGDEAANAGGGEQ